MRLPFRHALTLLPALALCAAAADTTGCDTSGDGTANCTTSLFISPTSVTLDHTLTGNGNSQTFSTGTKYTGNCIVSNVAILYNWNVSDPVDATVSSTGAVSCINASAALITVYSSITTYSGAPLVPSNTPTNLPTAALTCK